MDDARLAAACGIYCGGCEHLEVRCTGCGGVEGKPFARRLAAGNGSSSSLHALPAPFGI